MSGTKRRIDPGVAHRLFSEPYRFEFFQAVRVLEHVFVRNGVRAQDVLARKLKFRNSLRMSFPASEIERLMAYTGDDEAFDVTLRDKAPDLDKVDEVDITPAFMGMLGAQGVLPSGYTEQLGQRELYHRDRAARAFLDIFTNRAVALFYAAWKKYRLALQYELDGKARFLPLVTSLAGLGSPSLRARLEQGRGQVFDQAIAFYAGGVMQRPLSAAMLENILREYFDADIRVEQFVGAWYDVPPGQRTRLGDPGAVLGRSALSGARVWQRNLRLRLWIGPLRNRRFQDFLPGGDAAAALAKWLTLLGGDSLEYQVRLTLHRDDVSPCSLGAASGGGRLGWDTYLCTRPSKTHRTGTSYLVHTLH